MALSQNTQVLFTTKANFMTGSFGSKHGDILVGNNAFEFYNSRNPNDYLQIPWDQVHLVRAQLLFKDTYIRGFFIDTPAGSFNFIVKEAGKTLKIMRDIIGNDKIVRSKPAFSFKNLFKRG